MKKLQSSLSSKLAIAVVALAAVLFGQSVVSAANTVLYWDADGAASAATGGTGIWNTTSPLWRLTTSAGTLQTYTNTAPSTITATLGGIAAAASIPAYLTLAPSTTINVNTIDFGGEGWLGYTSSGASGSVLNGASGSKIVLSAGAGATNATPTLTSNTAANHTINAILDGTVGLNKSADSGTLIFNGANTYTGTTTILGGNILYRNATAFGTNSAITVASGATAMVQGGIAGGSSAMTLSGAGTAPNSTYYSLGSVGALENLNGNNSYAGLITLGAAATIASDAGFLDLTNTGTITGSGFNLTLTGVGSGRIAGIIGTDTGTLTNANTGTWTLTGANAFTGATTITKGILNYQNGTAFGTNSAITVASGATAQVQGGITGGSQVLTLSGTGQAANGQNAAATGALENVSGTNSYAGAIVLGAAATIASDAGTLNLTGPSITGATFGLTLAGAGSGSISNNITTTTGTLTKSGAGIWTLSGANTYTGATTISAGTLALGSSGALGGGGNIIFSGGTLQFSAANTTDYSAKIVSSGSSISIDTNSQTVTLGALAGSNTGGLTKSGAGTLILNAANLYTGTTSVNAGTLQLSGASGNIAGTSFTLNGGTFVIDNTGVGNNNNARIADAATFSLAGGNLNYKGSDAAATNSTETIGAITVGNGAVSQSNGYSTVTITAGGSNTAILTAASFLRTAGTGGTALVNGTSLGANATAVNRFISTAAPSLIGTTSALTTGINAAVKNTAIVAYLVGEATATTGGLGTATGTANTFVTYNSTGSGFRPLNLTDEFTSNAITTGNNTYITTATAASSNTSINSLILNGGNLSINDGVTLTDSSGAVLFSGTSSINPTGTTGALAFGVEGKVTVNSGVTGTINTAISGNGLTLSGAGTLVLGGANTYTGSTLVSSGTLKLGATNAILTTSTQTTVNPAGTFDLGGFNQTLLLLNQSGTVTNTSGTASTLTVGNLSGSTSTASTTGSLSLIVNAGVNGSTLAGSYTNAGNLTFNANGTGGIALSGTFNNTGTITNSGSNSQSTTITGAVGSNVTNVIQNSPTSMLVLSGVNNFSAGALSIKSGAVNITTSTAAASAATGLATIFLGDTSGSASASLLLNGGLTIGNNITVQAGNTGTAKIGAIQNFSGIITFNGVLTLNKDVTLDFPNANNTGGSGYPGNQLNFTTITGTGGITITNSGLFTSTSGQAYGIGGTGVAANGIGSGITLLGPNTYQGDTRILAGALQLIGVGNLDAWVGTGSNPIYLGDTSGVQSARLFTNGVGSGTYVSTGTNLTKAITVQAGNGGISAIGSNSGNELNRSVFAGTITLDKSVYLMESTTFSGDLAKGASAPGAVSVTSSSRSNSATILSGSKTYDGGTTVGIGILSASPFAGLTTGNFGTGNVLVEDGILRITGAENLASGKLIHVNPLGEVSIASNNVTQANLVSLIDSTSSGAIGIAFASTYNGNLNLATIGNGLMYLGGETSYGVGSTYSGATLGANSDGNYRLGWGGASTGNANDILTITNSVLNSASAQLIVGGSLGLIGNIGGGGQALMTNGAVLLNASNTYTGGTVVNNNSRLVGQAAASGSPFGAGAVTLHDSQLELKNSGNTTTSATVGALSFDGTSTIAVDGVAAGNNTLTVGAITRSNSGTLEINGGAFLGSTAFLKTSGTAPATFATVATDGVGGTATMVAPYYYGGTVSSLDALTYGANGFASIATTLAAITGAPTNAYVKTTGAVAIAANSTIAALSFAGAVTNSTTPDVTLTISSGALLQSTGFASTTIGSNTVSTSGNRLILDFGGSEAVVVSNYGLTIYNPIQNASGLTKSGFGNLYLGGGQATVSTFTGPITINSGGITITNDSNLGTSTNGIFLNGGGLYSNTTSLTINSGRTITLGEAGGSLGTSVFAPGYGSSVGTSTMTVAGQVTGTGASLSLVSANYGLTNSNVSNTIILSNTANDFIAPIYLGADLQGRAILAFSDDRQLGNLANTITIMNGNSALQYTGATGSTARGIVFSDMGGSIEVVTGGVTLTDSGTISGSGMFNKNGNGNLALTGSAAGFSGTVNVNAGVLSVSHAAALGATTAAISGNSGVSGGAVYVQSGAALEVQGNIAISGTGGKTMYLNGSGISNGGALRSVSGSNSNAGALILQSDTTIGVDAGVLALAGIVSGTSALTKVGSGSLVLSGNNTYFGNTTVSVGSLLVNGNASAATGIMNVASGAVLGGTGTLGGAVTVQSGGSLLGGDGSTSSLALTSSSNVTFSAGSHIVLSLGGSLTNSSLARTGGVWSFDTNQSFSFNDFGAATGTYHNLITGLTGTESGLGTIASWTNTNGWTGTFVLNGSSIDMNLISTPEPATWALLTFSLAAVMIFRRRRE